MTYNDTPLIPRTVLFGNPDRASVQLSPDGSQIAYLAPRDGVLNVWVAPRDDLAAARPVTDDTGRGIRFYGWAYTNTHILYIQDKNGDENWRLYVVDLQGGGVRDLTPFEGVQARLQELSPDFPHEVLVTINNRNAQLHDLYRLDIRTGELTLVRQNDGFMAFLTDDAFRLRGAMRMTPDGGLEMYQPAGDDWSLWETIPAEDSLTTGAAGFDKSMDVLFMRDSRGRDTAALLARNLTTGATTLLAEDAQVDVGDIVRHPTERHVQAVSFVYTRKRWQILDPAIEPDLAHLRTIADGEAEIVSRTLDDRFWIVLYLVDDGPARFYLYDRTARAARFLFTNRQDLEGQPLAKMHAVTLPARDGLTLVAYYTLPLGSDSDGDGIPDRPVPLVLFPHGGPWGRDTWGYNPWHQWLANRGYAALCVNFRSSTGFGKGFINAGNFEWGGKIMDDQIDAVRWAVGSADRRSGPRGRDGRQLRRLLDVGRPDLQPGGLCVRRRSGRPVEPRHAAGIGAALLAADVRAVRHACRRSAHRRRPRAAQEALAADLRGAHLPAAADRPGRQRSAGEAGRIGPDRAGDAGQGHPGHLRALPRRGARLRPPREQPIVHRHRRGVPGALPGRPLPTDRRRLPAVEPDGARGRGRSARPAGSAG